MLLLVLLFLFHLLIMLNLRIMMSKLASENIDKGKSILGATPKFDKKETKNPRAKRGGT